MSFADGLAFERQDKDDKKREEVLAVIAQLRRVSIGDLSISSEGSPTIMAAIKYLREYAKGGQLK